MKKQKNAIRWLALPLLLLATYANATCTQRTARLTLGSYEDFNAPHTTAQPWEDTRIYNQGDIVANNFHEYQARWWTQGNTPGGDQGEVWKLTVGANGIPQAWQAGQVYYSAEQTLYQGKIYKAKWWSKSSAFNAADWTYVRTVNPLDGVRIDYYNSMAYVTTCSSMTGSGQSSVSGSYLIKWKIESDAQSRFAYWKQVDNGDPFTPPEKKGKEVARGTEREGSMSGTFPSTAPINPDNPPKLLFFCTGGNECLQVKTCKFN